MIALRPVAVKFTVFALASVLLGVVLVNTMRNGIAGDTSGYRAVFADVAGLRAGDDVRMAGVRVGRVQSIEVVDQGALVRFEVQADQRLPTTSQLVMRYQNLLGQRYLAVLPGTNGAGAKAGTLQPGATIPLSRTNPGFDLTELLNGFRPLFDALQPADVNTLATSLVKVLQGEGGTVESLLQQTAKLTSSLADRDEVFDKVLVNLTPVLRSMAGQGEEIRANVRELRGLMTGLARDRKSIGASVQGLSELIGSTSGLVRDARADVPSAVRRFRAVMHLFLENKDAFVRALSSFRGTLGDLGRASSYENAVNLYLCSVVADVDGHRVNLNGSDDGPWSEVCR